MYRAPPFSASRILIIKTSSLGDIIQSFVLLPYLKQKFPDARIDWAVERRFASIVEAHPFVHRTIAFDSKKGLVGESISLARKLRGERYDVAFDLQGNCKSGLVTLLAKSRFKVGYGRKSVREWPNLLATNRRFEVSSNLNIRLQLLSLIQQFLGDSEPPFPLLNGVRFKISGQDQKKIEEFLAPSGASERIMVCPGSMWKNKQLPFATLAAFLERIDQSRNASFFLIWGSQEERSVCEALQERLKKSWIIDRLELPVWQNLMHEMHIVIAYDSGALHLAGTTATPSFSIFGPTMPEIFKPLGVNHVSMRGECPYLRTFEKQCPLLRTCPTGACIRNLAAEEIFRRFSSIDRNRCGPPPAGSPAAL